MKTSKSIKAIQGLIRDHQLKGTLKMLAKEYQANKQASEIYAPQDAQLGEQYAAEAKQIGELVKILVTKFLMKNYLKLKIML